MNVRPKGETISGPYGVKHNVHLTPEDLNQTRTLIQSEVQRYFAEQIQEIFVKVQQLHKEQVQHKKFQNVSVQTDPTDSSLLAEQEIKLENDATEPKVLSHEIANSTLEQQHGQTTNKNDDSSKTNEILTHAPVELRRRSLQFGKSEENNVRRKYLSTIEIRRASFDERECLANALQFHVESLVDGIVFHESELPDCLLAEGCLTDDECAGVRKLRDRKDQIRILLSLIKGRDLRVLKGFVKHVKYHNHNVAAKIQEKFEDNKNKGIKSNVCSLCQLKTRFNVKHVADSLWANQLIDDGLYNTIIHSESPVGAQGELWSRIIQTLNCLDVQRAELANKMLLTALRSKNLFTHLADGVQSMVNRNYGKLGCSCEPKPKPGFRDSSTASGSSHSPASTSSDGSHIDPVNSVGTNNNSDTFVKQVSKLTEDVMSLTNNDFDSNESGHSKVPGSSISGHNSQIPSRTTESVTRVFNQAYQTTSKTKNEPSAIRVKSGVPKQPSVKFAPHVTTITSNQTQNSPGHKPAIPKKPDNLHLLIKR